MIDKKIYCFDLDDTLCETSGKKYTEAIPIEKAIKEVNRLYDEGNYIKIFTARGTTSKIDWTDATREQLRRWGLKYHELLMNIKPSFDILIDDRAINAIDWRKKINPKVGLIAGAFDLIHPGYILMFEDAKTVCDHLIIALQTDPTLDRPFKMKPVQSIEERRIILSGIKFVDEIKIYSTEQELYNLLKTTKIDVRILGSDYENVDYNGKDLNIPVHFHRRHHNWSTTNLKNKLK
jgi:glycerol-3-phosphate cytidylyltransferase